MKVLAVLSTICLFAAACESKPSTGNAHTTAAAAAPHPAPKPKFVPDSPYVLKSLDTSEVFALLFDSPHMQKNTAIWSPHFSERMGFRVSYDDSCHTVMDTILHFKDEGDRDCAVIVFVTYRYRADSTDGSNARISDCHSCGATVGMGLFSHRGDGMWELYSFQKGLTSSGIFGGSGQGGAGEFSLVSIGDSWTALLLKKPVFANMGHEEGVAELYSIEEFNLSGFPESPLTSIFSYLYHDSVYDEPGHANKEDNAILNVVKRKKQYFIIQLVTTTNGKRKTMYYQYSDEENSCVAKRKG
jgi:hypothetical protein